eukprot:726965_1
MQSYLKNLVVLLYVFVISTQWRCIPGFGETKLSKEDCAKKKKMEDCFAVQNTGCIWDPIVDADDDKTSASLAFFIDNAPKDSIAKIQFNPEVTKATQKVMKERQQVTPEATLAKVKGGLKDKEWLAKQTQHLKHTDGTDWLPKEFFDAKDEKFNEADYAKTVVTTTVGPDGVVYDISWNEKYLNTKGKEEKEEQVQKRLRRLHK